MSQNGRKPITILGVRVNNYRRLTVAQLKLKKGTGLVRITGENAAGKTSLLRAIRDTLGGAKGMAAPEQAVREGAEEATTTLTLSNGFTVERAYAADNPKGTLVVRSEDGGRYSQTQLNSWLGPLAFDPLSFFALTPDKQRDTLLALGTDPDLPVKLMQLKARRAALYEERTPHLVAARGARSIMRPEGERPEPVDTGAEMARLAALQREQQQLERALLDHQRLQERIAHGRTVVADLEAKLAAARGLLSGLEQEETRSAAVLASLPDRSDAIAAVQGHIADAQAINQQLQPWAEWEKAHETIRREQAAADRLSEAMEACDQEKVALLAASGIDLPGVTFDDEGLPLLNGRPLAAASGRERIELAVAVAMKANPQLRICLVDEANDLDLKALERLDALAREHSFQIWCVRIGLEGPGEVVVEDGVARDREDSPTDAELDAMREQSEQDALAADAEAEAAEVESALAEYEAARVDPEFSF